MRVSENFGVKFFQNTHFLRAARAGNLEKIQYYLEEKVEIDTANQVKNNCNLVFFRDYWPRINQYAAFD